jgi:SAM-dependent methyltransferase
MSQTIPANQEQATLWNEASGRTWVELQELLDATLAPFIPPLLDSIEHVAARVLDIGCGAGATTRAAARRAAEVVGIDISAPLLEVAQRRAAEESVDSVSFVHADAQTHAFMPHSFDAAISRFGVMFFGNPVAAFANIRQALCVGGVLTLIAWRSAAENPFMTASARAIAPLFPPLPASDPSAPGPFAFADRERVRRILSDSDWHRVEVNPLDLMLSVPERHVRDYVTRLGPAGAMLRTADEETRVRAIPLARAAVEPFMRGGHACFNAACWLVTARA